MQTETARSSIVEDRTAERAASNVCGRRRPLESYAGFPGDPAGDLLQRERVARSGGRAKLGDRLGMSKTKRAETDVLGAFRTQPMGDHLAVDIAQAAHAGLLRTVGCLRSSSTIEGTKPLPDKSVLEGLCIDDDFVLDLFSLDGAAQTSEVSAEALLSAAERGHTAQALPGSTSEE